MGIKVEVTIRCDGCGEELKVDIFPRQVPEESHISYAKRVAYFAYDWIILEDKEYCPTCIP